MKLTRPIDLDVLQDIVNIAAGVFWPLKGFMTSSDYHNVTDTMRLSDGSVWSIPFSFDVDAETFRQAESGGRLYLTSAEREIGFIEVEDGYRVNPAEDARKVYKTDDPGHPMVKRELERSPFRLGGVVTVTELSLLDAALHPEATRKVFKEKGWATVVAFHTRNPVHRAHEHLQRTGMEVCDGLFINPFLGWKKPGDFSDAAIVASYRAMLESYYPRDRVYFTGFTSCMRYAGPREALFHAAIRRNLGCTHQIVGRDHAGVGDYYGRYEAQELALSLSGSRGLGIEILPLKEPYYCAKCGEMVSETNCGHGSDYRTDISGTRIREMLRNGEKPDERFLRPEVADTLLALGDGIFQ